MSDTTANQGQKLWSFSYLLVLLTTFTSNITMTMFIPLLPIFIRQMGYDSSISGLAIGLFTLVALLCRPLFGWLLDTRSKKPVLIVGGVIIAASCVTYNFVALLPILFILRAIHAIGYSASTNATATFTAIVVPPARRGEGMGYYGFVFTASIALGPALSMSIFHAAGMNAVFYTAFGIAAAGFLLSTLIRIAKVQGQNPPTDKKAKSSLIEETALPACSVMVIVGFAYIAITSFLSSYGFSIGLGGMSSFFYCYAATLFVCRIVVGKYTDKHGMYGVLIPGIICMTVVFLLLSLVRIEPLFLLAAVLFGIGYGMIQPTLHAIVIASCPIQRRGAAGATFLGSLDLGMGVGAVVWGFFSAQFGYAMMYRTCIAVMAVACICCVIFIRKHKNKE